MDFLSLIDNLEFDLRNGDVSKFFGQIEKIDLSEIPDVHRLSIANICRRAGKPTIGLQVLDPIVNNSLSGKKDSEPEIEYCLCLKETGAVFEAQYRLGQLDNIELPSFYNCEINLAFSQSDFVRVIEAADKYLDRFDNHTYLAAVVQVNRLAAKVVIGDLSESMACLTQLESRFQKEKWIRLLTNSKELLAQVFIQKNDFSSAEEKLMQADGLGISSGLKDQLFVERWKAVIESRRSGKVDSLIKLRARAVDHYETMRAIDFEILKVQFSNRGLEHLFFGTSFPCYRQMLENEFGGVPNYFSLHPEAADELSLLSGEFNGQPALTIGGKIHHLLCALLSDFYRPIKLGTVFHHVFPEEIFDAENSANRIHQLIFRARQWISDQGLPIEITECDKDYKLSFVRPLKLTLSKSPVKSRADYMLEQLRESFSMGQFTASEAEKALDAGNSTIHRAIVLGLNRRILERSGFGRNTRYFFDQSKNQ